jgi:hypothetical protein
VRVLADPDNPALLRDLAIDNEWDRLYLHDDDAPEGVLPTNGHSLTMAQRYKIISTRVWLYKADDDWPDQRIGADFPFSRQPGETCTQAMRRHFEDADTEDVERDDGPGLNGPLLLPGERWPTTWEQAYWLAGQEDGLYMGQRGLDNHRSTRQAIRAQAGIVEARGFGAEWTTVGTIKR